MIKPTALARYEGSSSSWTDLPGTTSIKVHEFLEFAARDFNGPLNPRSSFPQRLGFCRRCGVGSPRIIEKVNWLRNAVEHEYRVPSREKAEDFVGHSLFVR
jgi:hypothetical protein